MTLIWSGSQGSLGTLKVWKWIDLDVVHVVPPMAHRGLGTSKLAKCKGRWSLVAPGTQWGHIVHRTARCMFSYDTDQAFVCAADSVQIKSVAGRSIRADQSLSPSITLDHDGTHSVCNRKLVEDTFTIFEIQTWLPDFIMGITCLRNWTAWSIWAEEPVTFGNKTKLSSLSIDRQLKSKITSVISLQWRRLRWGSNGSQTWYLTWKGNASLNMALLGLVPNPENQCGLYLPNDGWFIRFFIFVLWGRHVMLSGFEFTTITVTMYSPACVWSLLWSRAWSTLSANSVPGVLMAA